VKTKRRLFSWSSVRPEDEYSRLFGITHPAHTVVRVAAREIHDRAAKYFTGGRMIEIGCGTKRKTLLVGEFVKEHVGLDHEGCPHDQSNIDVFGTASEIPAESASFDCALSTAVLEHLEEPQKAIDEACRVLKPGGYAIYTAPLFWHLHEQPRDFFRYTCYGLERLFKLGGFEVLEVSPLSGFWITFGTELCYYLQRFRRGFLKPLIDVLVAITQWTIPILDRGVLRDNRFTWMYLVVARKPIHEEGQSRG
jgi:ubiquinone/menaquinone biosynthesis C-methylase UbiE